jgi:hypothetical protein
MKDIFYSLTVVIVALSGSWTAAASGEDQSEAQIVTKCRLYSPPSASLEIPSVGNQKFELNGLLVETKETNGCSIECYSIKEISITENGVTFSSLSETKERTALFPSLSLTKNGTKQTVQCILTRAQ